MTPTSPTRVTTLLLALALQVLVGRAELVGVAKPQSQRELNHNDPSDQNLPPIFAPTPYPTVSRHPTQVPSAYPSPKPTYADDDVADFSDEDGDSAGEYGYTGDEGFLQEICCNLWYRPERCCGYISETKLIFVTSTEFSADLTKSAELGGVTGADAICQSHASAVGHEGLFKAWIATDEDDTPRERFSRHKGNYVRADNEVVFKCWHKLVSGDNPVNTFWMDEKKKLLTTAGTTQGAATNVDEFGNYFENSENQIGSCMDWTYDTTRGGDLTPSEMAVGVSENGFGLRPDNFIACNQMVRLICVEQ